MKGIVRHFDIGANSVLTSKVGETCTKNYAIKFKDLVPELAQWKYCSPQLFQGSGLEITLKVLDSNVCCSSLYSATEDVATSRVLPVVLSVSNVYTSMVLMNNPTS